MAHLQRSAGDITEQRTTPTQLAALQLAPMSNVGLSCYINATLAALYASRHVRQHIAAFQHPGSRLAKTFMAAVAQRGHSMQPTQLTQKPFYNKAQRDAQEFLGEILATDSDNGVESLCRGHGRSRLRCRSCGYSRASAGSEAFTCLHVPIVEEVSVPIVQGDSVPLRSVRPLRSVQVALDHLLAEEVISSFK